MRTFFGMLNHKSDNMNLLDCLKGGRKNLAARIVKLYISGDAPTQVRDEFLAWLGSEVHLEEKNKVMLTVWESAPASCSRKTFKSLLKIKARLKMQKPQRRDSLLPRFGRYAAAVILPLMAIAGFALWSASKHVVFESSAVATVNVEVPKGGSREIVLSDGTKVLLRGGSELSYPDVFSGLRSVYLEGEAFFDVTKGKHPFVINTRHSTVKVLGTSFKLVDYKDDREVVITMERGTVEAQIGQESYLISQGEELYYDHQTELRRVSRLSEENLSTIRHSTLAFERRNLKDIFRTIERYYGVSVVFDGKLDCENYYTTRFNPDEMLEDVLLVLQNLTNEFTYLVKNDTVNIYTGECR